MRRRKGFGMLLATAALMIGLTGCAENQIPDMSEEEMKEIGEFVAFTMMKYDAGHRSRLMELPPEVETEVPEESESEPIETPAPETGMDPVDDTPTVDVSGTTQTEEASYSAEEVMGLPEGVTFTFVGKELHDSYPEGSDAFSITATEGKKLLVLTFSLENTLDQEARIDLLSSGTSFRIAVNEERSKKALSTMWPDDLAFYADTLAAGASAQAVLLIDVDADLAESITAVSLEMRNESKSYTVQLIQE